MVSAESAAGLQFDPKWLFVPQNVHFLVQPIHIQVTQFEVEMEKDASKYETHLVIRKATKVSDRNE